ncbi:MAG TPA: winged helix-turn-helix domain-containing protein [Usitatibacter sp.]|nr:winged helix-turn-helix domain-containing protein [Usitatibacter sp.]
MDLPLLAPISCLADPQRRAIFELIAERPADAAELAARLGLPAACVARHLRALEEARLVVAGAARPAVYRIDCARWATLRQELDAAWARNTARLWLGAPG